LLTPVTQETARWKGNCIRAAKAAAVEHIVNLSVANVGLQSPVNLFRWHAEAEQELEASGIVWTHLRPTDLGRYNTRLNLPTIQDHGAFYSTIGDGKVALVDEADVAEVAAAALLQPKHRGKIYTLTGPAALSYPEVAETIATVLGKPVKYVDVTPEQAKQSMLAAGMPEWLADFINSLRQLERDGGASQVSPDVETVLGRPATPYVDSVRAALA
ncbi:MAG: NmrA family NAD(P)-binding protein, partial [Verrucomicrobia bacterium]|nr:NmrA family NAD(P)-binding protein [Verrucomicrobiota bacterium]